MEPGDDLTHPVSLYRQVAARIRDHVDTGRYKPGDLIPTELQLAEQFSVSRQTIRQAVALLTAQGVVDVERGRGTFVRTPPIKLPLRRYGHGARRPGAGPFESTCADLGVPGYGELVVVERRPADDMVAGGLSIPVDTEIIYRRRYMHAGDPDAIIQIQEGHLPLDLVHGTVLAGTGKVTDGIYAALESIGHPPVRVTEHVSARMPTYSESTVFRAKSGVPVIEVQRTTYGGTGRVLEWLVVTAVADRNIFVYEDLPLDGT